MSDVIVVGAGLAGSAAACRASELGRSIVLVDAAEDPTAGGNTTLSTGGMHLGPRLDPTAVDAETIAARLEQRTAGEARPEIVEAIAGNAARAIAWLQTQGPELLPRTPGDLYPRLGPTKRDVHDIHDWHDKGPQQTLRALQDTVRSRGGEVRGAMRITELARDGDGAIAGVVAEDGTRFAGRAVVLADGGFGADPELRRRHIGPAADRLFLRGAPNGRGDALRMGETAGARLAHLDWFYGHCLHGNVFDNDRLWPWPGLDEVMTDDGGVYVDASGRRVVDESLGGVAVANVAGRADDPFGWVVISEKLWDEAYGREVAGHLAANPELERRGARILRAPDAHALAALVGLDGDVLAATLEEYSEAARTGRGTQLPVPRAGTARPLDGALVALAMAPGITYTTGGLLIDERGRVLDQAGAPIGALHAAGAAAASVNGGANAGYGGGLMTALVTGLLAGETAAAWSAQTVAGSASSADSRSM